MDALIACEGCARHVRASESACPFCRTARTPSEIAPRPVPRRLGRAATFAFGAALATSVTACSQSHGDNDAAVEDSGTVSFDSGGIGPLYGAVPFDGGVAP